MRFPRAHARQWPVAHDIEPGGLVEPLPAGRGHAICPGDFAGASQCRLDAGHGVTGHHGTLENHRAEPARVRGREQQPERGSSMHRPIVAARGTGILDGAGDVRCELDVPEGPRHVGRLPVARQIDEHDAIAVLEGLSTCAEKTRRSCGIPWTMTRHGAPAPAPSTVS